MLLEFSQAAWLVHYRKGKQVRLQTFTERKQALEAAGLSERARLGCRAFLRAARHPAVFETRCPRPAWLSR